LARRTGSNRIPDLREQHRYARLGTLSFVVGERQDAFDVFRTTTKAIRELLRGYALVTPTHQTTFDRSESGWCVERVTVRKTRELEDALDVVFAAVEAPSDVCRRDAGGGELADPTFDWP
jgi:hypothetical protein